MKPFRIMFQSIRIKMTPMGVSIGRGKTLTNTTIADTKYLPSNDITSSWWEEIHLTFHPKTNSYLKREKSKILNFLKVKQKKCFYRIRIILPFQKYLRVIFYFLILMGKYICTVIIRFHNALNFNMHVVWDLELFEDNNWEEKLPTVQDTHVDCIDGGNLKNLSKTLKTCISNCLYNRTEETVIDPTVIRTQDP